MSKPMFEILFEDHNGRNWYKACKSVNQKNMYVEQLTEAGIESHVIGEASPQLCYCSFTTTGGAWTYVRYEGDAEPGYFGTVDTYDDHGRRIEKDVFISDVRPTTIKECNAIAKKWDRNTLTPIKKIWQKKLPY